MENGLAITTGIGDISFWSIIADVAMSSFAKEQNNYTTQWPITIVTQGGRKNTKINVIQFQFFINFNYLRLWVNQGIFGKQN